MSVALPAPLKDLDVDLALEWSQPATPTIEDPWTGALVEHERCTESWSPLPGGDSTGQADAGAPVVPLDARVLLTFAKPMGDDLPVADNPPAAEPSTPIGDYTAAYALAALRLHRWRRSHPEEGWLDVTDTIVATWTPDAGDAGSRLQLFARSPFAFTRSTSRRWVDSFLDAQVTWPCTPAPAAVQSCIDWDAYAVGAELPRLWEQDGAILSSEAPLTVQNASRGGRAVQLRWGSTPAGIPQPGLLWIGLPQPAAEVSALVEVPEGDWVVLRAWAGDEQVAVQWGVPGTVTLRVAATRIDAVTLGWGFNVEPALVSVCWITQSSAEARDTWSANQQLLEIAASRWSSDEPILEPDSHYLLEVTTRALLTRDGAEVERIEGAHSLQFQTGGPPGIVPAWVPVPPPPTPNTAARFPHGGVLQSLAPYVRWSIPDPGARPVFRAYDLGCEFDAGHVQQMYGADMRVRVRDHDGLPALDPAGAEIVFENAWEEAPSTTLTTSEASWLSRLDACTGAVEWGGLTLDERVRTQMPGLLYDDFSGTLATAWSAHVLDPTETRPANWHLDAGVLSQDVDIAGGDSAPASPDKPGTVYVAADVAAADVAVETLAWATSGVYGLILRWRGTGDYYRFSIGPQRLRLVRVEGGAVHELWSSPGSYEPGIATLLAVQAEGPRIRCQVGERIVCDIEDAAPGVPGGSVGLYTWDSDSAAFDELRARAWPGAALAPEQPYTAELEASRPLFEDPLDDLAAFEQVTLSTGAASTTSSAANGVATIACPKASHLSVAALGGDPAGADYAVECNARPDGSGVFGLVARHVDPDRHLALQLVAGSRGRSLVEHDSRSGGFGQIKVLWADDGEVDVGATYSLGLRCEGTSVTVSIDGIEFSATTSLVDGRFALLSGIPLPGCAFSDLVVRSAPRAAVHAWNFTTSRYLGLPDLLDTFAGRVWPLASEAHQAELAGQADSGTVRLSAARAAVVTARAALATAVAAGDAVELARLGESARAAIAFEQAESAVVHDLLTSAIGTPWRPTPPVVELSTIAAPGGIVALLLDLPEPLPWERIDWSLVAPGSADEEPLADLLLAYSGDGTGAILVRSGAAAFTPGTWRLQLALRLNVGSERAAWRRGGARPPKWAGSNSAFSG